METKIKVAIADFSPLVITEEENYRGFEIDLWEAIAKEMHIDFEYQKHAFQDIIPLLCEKKVDVGLAGITINERREKIIDFSHPTLDSGLLILVNKKRASINILKSVRSFLREGYKTIIPAAMGVLIFIAIFAHLLWFAEKGVKTFSQDYLPGIFESAWLVIGAMSTDSFGDYEPHTWIGRIIITGIIIGGVAIFGLLIAQVTAFIAIKKIRDDINSYRDLANKRVATVANSTSVSLLKKIGADVVPVLKIQEAYQKLEKDEIDAVVFDAPVLVYFSKSTNKSAVQGKIVGNLFEKQKYGIALQSASPLREMINQSILKFRESGYYDSLYQKWFGEDTVLES